MTNSEGLCRAIREEGLLIRLLDGELPPNEEHKILTHLRTCHECLGLTADLLYTDDRLKVLFDRHTPVEEKPQKKASTAGRFMLEVDKLPIGRAMDRDLLDEDNNLLVAAGTELSPTVIESLKRRGIQKLALRSVEIDTEEEAEEESASVVTLNQVNSLIDEGLVEPAISTYVRNECIAAVRNCFKSLEEDGDADFKEINEAAMQVTEEVLGSPQAALSLADMILMDKALHSHSVNVLVLFLMISRAMGHPAQLIREHATAALMHDVGRIVIRRTNALQKRPNDHEGEDQDHSETGYTYLWNLGGFKESALKMVMNHHERYDGRGYPRQLKGTGLSDWDQILIISNTYDHLTWNRKSGLRSGFHQALSTFIQEGSKYARKGIVRAVVKSIGHYPPGSYVKMNSGEVCLVTKAYPGSPLKPQVSIMYDSSGQRQSKPRILDLVHNQAMYIIGPAPVETRI